MESDPYQRCDKFDILRSIFKRSCVELLRKGDDTVSCFTIPSYNWQEDYGVVCNSFDFENDFYEAFDIILLAGTFERLLCAVNLRCVFKDIPSVYTDKVYR